LVSTIAACLVDSTLDDDLSRSKDDRCALIATSLFRPRTLSAVVQLLTSRHTSYRNTDMTFLFMEAENRLKDAVFDDSYM